MLCQSFLSCLLHLLTFILFFSFSTLPSFSYCASSSSTFQSPSPALPPSGTGRADGGKYGVELSWRSAVEGPIVEPVENPSLALAPRRTYRKDPLDGFKRYNGGWNISNEHYWASVGYTAAPLFVTATVWFLGFGLCLLVVCLCHFCCARQPYGYSQTAYVLSLTFLILFSIAAIIGCVVLYTGQGKFHQTSKETVDYVVNQADTTVQKLRAISDYLASAKLTGVDKVYIPSNVQTDIDDIELRISSSANTLADRTRENSDDIQDLLDSLRVAMITIAAIMLLITFLGLLFSIFGIQLLVYILVIVGWLLVTGTFILCGTFLLLHNVTGDTCVAMDQWALNPTAHTALDDILPCMEPTTAQETLRKSKEVTTELVEVINQVITNVSNINFSPNFPPMYFNQSGPLVPILCNPFHSDLTDRVCSPGELDLYNATQVWSTYVCQVSETGICITPGRLTPTFYDQMTSVVNVSNALYNDSPFLLDLEDCTFARDTFSHIYTDQCPHLQEHSRLIYVGLLIVSTAVMLSLIFWVIFGRERRHRVYTKQQQARSDQSSEANRKEN